MRLGVILARQAVYMKHDKRKLRQIMGSLTYLVLKDQWLR